MLLSRTKWPPGGWQYHEAATGWRAPEGLTFDQVVQAIIDHRKRNAQYHLNTDPNVVATLLDDFTCARLKNQPSYCSTNVPPSFISPLRPSPQFAEAQNAVGENSWLRNTTAGIKVWIEWFGEGKPVDSSLANKRASICVGCPKNHKIGIKDWFSTLAAKEIMAIFSALNDLDLHTELDDKLAVCKACDCPLKAKVWAPLRIIKEHTRPEVFAKLDPRCWMLHEKSE